MHPPRLSPGDTIGIVSPARWLEQDRLHSTTKTIEAAGYAVMVDPQNGLRDGSFAGPDSDRAEAIQRMFADPDIKAIICARGGYGCPRIADMLDYGAIRSTPKIFAGYSDVTSLLLSLYRHVGLTVFHSPMLIDMARGLDADSLSHLLATVSGGDASGPAARMTAGMTALRPGVAEGPLIGGNLTLLANMIGTGSDFHSDGAILFIEDLDEYLYNLDRMLVHLKRAGRFNGLAGLVLGSFTNLMDNDIPFGRTWPEMAMEHCADATFPIIQNFPVGHARPNMTMPIGARARIEARDDGTCSFSLLESPVS